MIFFLENRDLFIYDYFSAQKKKNRWNDLEEWRQWINTPVKTHFKFWSILYLVSNISIQFNKYIK